MSLTDPLSSSSTWVLRGIIWAVALFIIFALGYKVMHRKQIERKVACIEQAASEGRATSPITSVDKYAACVGPAAQKTSSKSNDTRPARCRYVGVWAATRGNMVYQVTLNVDGRFVAEPGTGAPPNAQTITGAWSVAGTAMTWAYDNGPVWPPDINPISADTADAFTLSEVNGSTTRYSLIERFTPALCKA